MATDNRPSLAEAMYPSLRSNSPEAKAREKAQTEVERQRKFYRDLLLRHLREHNAKTKEERR